MASLSYWRRLAQTQLDELVGSDKKHLERGLERHRDDAIHVCCLEFIPTFGKLQSKPPQGKPKTKPFIFLIGRNRFYGLIPGQKRLVCEEHLLDIVKVWSPTPSQLTVATKNVELMMTPTKGQAEELVGKLFGAYERLFPISAELFPFSFIDEKRLTKLKSFLATERSQCEGFSECYESICDWQSVRVCEDISWSIDNLFDYNELREFNLNELILRPEKISVADCKCLFRALQENVWFTSLKAEGKFDREILTELLQVFRFNRTITSLTLTNAGAFKETWNSFVDALADNPRVGLTHIDLSGNYLEEKGITGIANCIRMFQNGITSLNVSNCHISSTGIAVLISALSEDVNCQTLKELNISGNRLDSNACRVLGNFLEKSTTLAFLSVSDILLDFSRLKGSSSLVSLDISGSRFPPALGQVSCFLHSMPQLKKLKMANCQLSPSSLRHIFLGLPGLKSLDLSDNDLGEKGLETVIASLESLCMPLEELHFNRNFPRKEIFGSRSEIFEKLSYFLKSEQSRVHTLSLQGGHKRRLKRDLVPFILGLMTNRTLKVLDIRANHCGNSLAAALGKTLQTNQTLRVLYWDENGTTFTGFQIFRMGLSRNCSLVCAPQPTRDVSHAFRHDKERVGDKLSQVLQEIQERLAMNGGQVNFNEPEEFFEPAVGSPRTRSRLNSPKLIDTQKARKVFDQFDEMLSSDEMTEEEMNQVKKLFEARRQKPREKSSSFRFPELESFRGGSLPLQKDVNPFNFESSGGMIRSNSASDPPSTVGAI